MIIELYTRPGCHLCEEAKKVLLDAQTRFAFEFIERNVKDNAQWESAFGTDIPVVFINGRKSFKHRVDPTDLHRRLSNLK